MGCSCFGRPAQRGLRQKSATDAEENAVRSSFEEPLVLQDKPSASDTAGVGEAATPLARSPAPDAATPSQSGRATPESFSCLASPNDSAASADPAAAVPGLSAAQDAALGSADAPPKAADSSSIEAARTGSRFSTATSGSVTAAEAGDTVADILPGARGARGSGGSLGGSGGSNRSNTPAPRSDALQARSDLYARLPAVLRTRSGGPLEGVEIGPLLGKGSFGCVYKGRWKGAMVAIKVLEHALILQDDISRETLLSTSIAHPGVVITYRITTVRVNDEPPRDPGVEGQPTSKDSASGNGGVRPDVPHPSAPAAATQSAAAASPTTGSAAPQLSNTLAQREEIREPDTEKQQDVLETWMLLEYCDRGSLARAIERGKLASRLPAGGPDLMHVLMCLMDIASAMAYLHSVGVLHGDLKSANVLLKSTATDMRGYVCKLADFGLSRVLAENKTHVSTHTYGTISYMAPELLSLGKFAKAADVYSFAILMWELYSGEALFEGMTVGQVLYAVVYDNKRPAVPQGCPPEYASLMRDCWKVDPAQRPDFEEVLTRLQPLHDELRSLRRASNSLATSSAPGVGVRSLAAGLLPRTRSGENKLQQGGGVQAQSLPPGATAPSPLRPSPSQQQQASQQQDQQAQRQPSPPTGQAQAHGQVVLSPSSAIPFSSGLRPTPARKPRAVADNPFAAAQLRMQEKNVTSPTPETADPSGAAGRSSQDGEASDEQSAGAQAGEMQDTLAPLNSRATRLAMLHADSPSATQPFATLGTRSEGGWGSRAAYLASQPPAARSSAAANTRSSNLSTAASGSGTVAVASGSTYVSPFQAAQPAGGVQPLSAASVAASSGASGRSGSGGANAEAEAAAKAALRRIADPDAPERPIMPSKPAALPVFQKPVKDLPQESLRRYNST